jgi:hypothetical protein
VSVFCRCEPTLLDVLAAVARRGESSLVVALALPLTLPQYATRGYFGPARAGGLRVEANAAEREAYRWIRAHTAPDDVFLGSPVAAPGSEGRIPRRRDWRLGSVSRS